MLIAAEIYTPLPLLVMGTCAALLCQRVQAHEWSEPPQTWARVAWLLPLFVVSLMVMFSHAFNLFLYFQC